MLWRKWQKRKRERMINPSKRLPRRRQKQMKTSKQARQPEERKRRLELKSS